MTRCWGRPTILRLQFLYEGISPHQVYTSPGFVTNHGCAGYVTVLLICSGFFQLSPAAYHFNSTLPPDKIIPILGLF